MILNTKKEGKVLWECRLPLILTDNPSEHIFIRESDKVFLSYTKDKAYQLLEGLKTSVFLKSLN